MTPTDAAIAALSTAQRLLLEPHGLTEAMLLDAIAEMHAHRIDDSDLYFQYSQAEAWGMEEGIVNREAIPLTRVLACGPSQARRPPLPTATS
ncbi:MAG: hypothetical protein ACO3TB_01045 [Burkholderiaceae bacterium]